MPAQDLQKPYECFGVHLIMDGYGCDRKALSDLEGIYAFLDKAPARIGMTKIMPPYVFRYHGKVPEDWGLSGFVLIAESHISIHTFPDRGYLSLDIFSCKPFDTCQAGDLVIKQFRVAMHEAKVLNRGLEFPRAPNPVVDHLRQERQLLGEVAT